MRKKISMEKWAFFSTEQAHSGLYFKQNVLAKEITKKYLAALSKTKVSELAKLYVKESFHKCIYDTRST